MLKRRYLFIIMLVCFLTISAVNAEKIGNSTGIMASDDLNLVDESLNENAFDVSFIDDGTFKALQEKIDNASEKSTITLENDYFNAGNELDVTIGKNITIDGKNHVVDANHASRIFNIVESNVTLKNINFVNGHINYGVSLLLHSGGAIYCNGGVVNVIDCSFVNNSADYSGGAIYCNGGAIDVGGCSFVNNSARHYGGAVYSKGGAIDVGGCSFVNNSARYSGGAIYGNSELTADDCDFINNNALSAGALYLDNSSAVRNCDFRYNVADYGGAIYNSNGNNTVSGCNFIGNSNSTISFSTKLSGKTARTNLVYSNLNMDKSNDYADAISVEDDCLSIKGYYVDFDYDDDLVSDIHEIYISGNVLVDISGEKYEGTFSNGGKARIKLENLSAGVHDAKISYSGDENFGAFDINLPITTGPFIYLDAGDVTKYYGGPERFVVTLTQDNIPIPNEDVQITINSKNYTRTTDSNGQVSMAINLNSGIYNVTSEYDGFKTYSTIAVKSTVSGNDVTKIFKNGTQYYATFVDTKGDLMKNTNVKFNINGVLYTRTTNDQGVAKLNINLPPETYVITAENPNSTEKYTNVITVLPSIVENYDLTKYYKNASKYTLRIIGDNGKPVGEGVEVKLNINGIFYTRATNASGYINMNINLPPETYTITAEYNGLMASNKITVKPILTANDLTKKYGTSDPFVATLVDGQGNPYENQEVRFNINGVFYKQLTNGSGQAQLNINLPPGEYIITSMYSNGATISNKVTVTG